MCKDMKRFILGLILGIASTIALVFIINLIYVTLKTTEVETDKFESMPEVIEVCNLGSSHGKNSFIYDDWQDKKGCFNFGLTSQRYQYDYRLLLNYSDRLAEDAVVFIPFSYFSIYGNGEDDEFESRNNRYYKILPPELIVDYDPWVDICEHYLPVLSAYDDLIDVLKDAVVGDGGGNSFAEDIKDIQQDTIEQFNGQIKANEDENGAPIVDEERLEALYNIIELCNSKGVRAILITTPLTRCFTDYVKENDPNFLKKFYEDAMNIANSTGIEYYDYSCDDRFVDDEKLFIDAHHLNREGGKIFTKIIMEEVVM